MCSRTYVELPTIVGYILRYRDREKYMEHMTKAQALPKCTNGMEYELRVLITRYEG
jgi:hypothetical protein